MLKPGVNDWRRLCWGACGALAICLLSAATAQAETASDPATARALFAEARKLMAEKRYEQACPKFEESLRLDSGIGAMYNLADCWEHSGRTASAWAMFLDAAAAARAANQGERARAAKDRAGALEPKLSRMTIRLASVDSGLELRRDGQLLAPASYDVAVPVDPGQHRIEVTAPGKKAFSNSIDVAAAASVSVQVPKLETAEATAPATNAGAAPQPGSQPPAPATSTPDAAAGASHSKVLPFTLLGVGVAGLAVGTLFEVMSRGKNSDAVKICAGDSACTQADIDAHDGKLSDAKTDQTIAIVGAGVGAASLIAGIVLLTTHHAAPAQQANSAFRLYFDAGPHGSSVIAKGSF